MVLCEKKDEIKLYDLTNAEKRVWYNEKKFDNLPLHNIGGCIVFKSEIDPSVMERAVNDLIKNNDAFRIGFIEKEGIPYQFLNDFLPIKLKQMTFLSENEFKEWHESFFSEPFDLYKDKLYSFVLCKLSDNDHRLVVKMHHIIVDGWSFQLIAKALIGGYLSFINGDHQENNCAYSYIETLEKENKYIGSRSMLRSKEYWLERLKGLDTSGMPTISKHMSGKRLCFDLDKKKTKIIKDFANTNNILLQTLFIAAYYIYLNACSGRDDIIVGIPVFNRYGREAKNTIGMFTSTVAFRFGVDKQRNIKDYLISMNRAFMSDLRNQRYPYNLLMNDLKEAGTTVDNLMNVSINYYNWNFENDSKGCETVIEEFYCGYQFYDMQIVIKDWNEAGSFSILYDFKSDVYNEFQINELHDHLMYIIDCIIENFNVTVGDIPVFTPADHAKYILKYNATECAYPKDRSFIELFEECVSNMPDRCAIECDEIKYTYSELNEKAEKLAYFIHNDLKINNRIIGVCTLHSIESVIAILGILKAGCTYLPLDDKIPEERLKYIIDDSKLALILTNFDFKYSLDVPVLDINKCCSNEYVKCKLDVQQAEIAYIIYTSGTTGKPKGVMVKQNGLVNYILWAKKVYNIVQDDSFALYTSFAFDLTVTSIFTPLICGAKIVVYRDDQDRYVLFRIIEEDRVSIVKLTPAHLQLIADIDNSNSSINRLIVGGENLKHELSMRVMKSFNDNVHIFNEYGPTETVVGCMIYEFDPQKYYGSSVPIGKPADNVQIYLLDNDMKPVMPGEKGEMYIAGEGVAKGYINNETLTAKSFVPNIFGNGIMYKTGDIARFITEDTIEYICRSDNQVKVNGYRIELGEIEECIKSIEGVDEAVVEYVLLSNNNKVLCAYYSGVKMERKTIRSFLRNHLPDYMIPVYYTHVEKFELTSNGKLDRRNLPEIDTDTFYYSQNTDDKKKQILADILSSILNRSDLDLNDNFYSIGGDSIKAIQLMSRLAEFGYKINMKDILSAECLGEIADCIYENDSDIYDISHCKGTINNTPIYEWFIDNDLADKDHYLQSVRVSIDPSISPTMISEALRKIVDVHDGLRLNYNESTGFYYEEKYLDVPFEMNVIDESNDRVEYAVDELKKSIRLNGPVIKALLVKRENNKENLLVIAAHHIAVDGVSWQIIIDDLHTALNQLMDHQEIKLVREFTGLEQHYNSLNKYGETALSQLEYWKDQIRICDLMEQWNDMPDDKTIGENIFVQIELDKEKVGSFEDNLDAKKFSVSEVILTALLRSIVNVYNKNEIPILLESHGREVGSLNDDLSRTVGWFTTMYPVRFEFNNGSERMKMLDEVHMRLKRVPDNGIGYGVLRYILKKFSDNNRYIRFNYLGSLKNNYEDNIIKNVFPDMEGNVGKENKNTCLIDINCIRVNDRIVVRFECGRSFFSREELERLIKDLQIEFSNIVSEYNDSSKKNIMLSDFTAISLSDSDFDDLFE